MSVYYNEFDGFAAAWLRELQRDGLIPEGPVDETDIRELEPAVLAGHGRVHLFAGVAGWERALQLAGWGERDVWTGSCPCQPFSAAGKRKGTADDRHLWPAMFRLIDALKPPVIFGEQVSSGDALGWLDGVFADLEGAGYACTAADLCAPGVGAPHIRQRLFWVAYSQEQRASERTQAGEPNAKRDGATDGLEHAEHGRPQKQKSRSESGCIGGGVVRGLEHTAGHGRVERRPESVGRGATSGCGDGSGVGDAESANGQVPVFVGGSQQDCAELGGASGTDFWADSIWLACRDGKARRVPAIESGILGVASGLPAIVGGGREACPERFPLAGQVPNRTGLLRGFGNAIIPSLAAVFIRAFMEAT